MTTGREKAEQLKKHIEYWVPKLGTMDPVIPLREELADWQPHITSVVVEERLVSAWSVVES